MPRSPFRLTSAPFHLGLAAAASLYLFAYYAGSSLFGSLAGRLWSVGGWPVVVLMASALVAVCGLLAGWLRYRVSAPPTPR